MVTGSVPSRLVARFVVCKPQGKKEDASRSAHMQKSKRYEAGVRTHNSRPLTIEAKRSTNSATGPMHSGKSIYIMSDFLLRRLLPDLVGRCWAGAVPGHPQLCVLFHAGALWRSYGSVSRCEASDTPSMGYFSSAIDQLSPGPVRQSRGQGIYFGMYERDLVVVRESTSGCTSGTHCRGLL